jgi:hypothetical protein
LDRLLTLPLVQLVVCGRSGSMLVQAFLDGCPSVLQVPHTFKFYDFAAACGDFEVLAPETVAKAFVNHPSHAALFDSDCSVLLGGRLGEQKNARVLMDADAFTTAMAGLLGNGPVTPKAALFAALAAFGWCRGQDLSAVQVLLVHLHHGDWHWASFLADGSNISARPLRNWITGLAPDRVVVTLRNPMDQIRSCRSFVPRAVEAPSERGVWYERYLRLLAQDWLRLELYKAAGVALRTVRLEDLRKDKDRTINGLMGWLNLPPCPEALAEPTIYGLPWWGDIYTPPKKNVNSPTPMAYPSAADPDAAFLYAAAPGVAAAHGYPEPPEPGVFDTCAQFFFWRRQGKNWPCTVAQWWANRTARKAFLHVLAQRHAAALAAIMSGAAGARP